MAKIKIKLKDAAPPPVDTPSADTPAATETSAPATAEAPQETPPDVAPVKKVPEFKADKKTLKLVSDLISSRAQGEGAKLIRLSEQDSQTNIKEWIPYGIDWLDTATGGGVPVTRLTEIIGWEGSGKTALCERAIRNCQRMGGIVIVYEPERSCEKARMLANGIDLDAVVYSNESRMEVIFQSMEDLIMDIRKRYPDRLMLVVWDSVAAATTQAEMDAEYGEKQFSPGAFTISQAMRKIAAAITDARVALLFTNQLRTNVGEKYGPDYVTFGGNAIGFKAAIRIKLDKSTKIKLSSDEHAEADGIVIRCETIKNKTFGHPPFRKPQFVIMYLEDGGGISRSRSLFEYYVQRKLIQTVGVKFKMAGIEETFYRKVWPEFYKNNEAAVLAAGGFK